MRSINFDNLEKYFKNVKTSCGLFLKIEQGDIYALLGHNGVAVNL